MSWFTHLKQWRYLCVSPQGWIMWWHLIIWSIKSMLCSMNVSPRVNYVILCHYLTIWFNDVVYWQLPKGEFCEVFSLNHLYQSWGAWASLQGWHLCDIFLFIKLIQWWGVWATHHGWIMLCHHIIWSLKSMMMSMDISPRVYDSKSSHYLIN